MGPLTSSSVTGTPSSSKSRWKVRTGAKTPESTTVPGIAMHSAALYKKGAKKWLVTGKILYKQQIRDVTIRVGRKVAALDEIALRTDRQVSRYKLQIDDF